MEQEKNRDDLESNEWWKHLTYDEHTLYSRKVDPNATHIELTEKTKKIEYHCFSQCKKLRKIYIPDSVEYIDWSAFDGCSELEEVRLPNSLERLPSTCFKDCVSLKTIEIPDSVTVIGRCAFEGCTSLSEIRLSPQINSIGDSAFKNCASLSTVYIPTQNKVFINKAAFYGVPSPLKIVYGGDSETWKKCIERIVIEPEYTSMYGAFGSYTIEYPLEHPLGYKFICEAYCEKDGVTVSASGSSESYTGYYHS